MSVSENPFLVCQFCHTEKKGNDQPLAQLTLVVLVAGHDCLFTPLLQMFLLSLLFVCSTMILETGIFIELLWDQIEMKCCKHDLSSQNKYGWLLAHLCKWCWAIVHHRAGVIRCPEMVNLVQVVPDHTCYHVAERMRGKTNWLSLKVSQIMWWRELVKAHFKKLYSIPVMMLSHKILT